MAILEFQQKKSNAVLKLAAPLIMQSAFHYYSIACHCHGIAYMLISCEGSLSKVYSANIYGNTMYMLLYMYIYTELSGGIWWIDSTM